MKLTITKPDAILFDGEANLVQLPGSGGLFEMMNNHAPIIASLKAGQIRLVTPSNEEIKYAIRGGIVKGANNTITILAQ